MTRGYTSGVLTEEEYEDWDRLVASSPEGSPYHSSEYLDVICRCAGGDSRILAVRDGQELVGGVPLYERESSTGVFVQPRLLLYYNGLVLRDYDTKYPSKITSRHLGIMEALERGLTRLDHAHVELRCRSPRADLRPFVQDGWSASPSYTYVVDLSDTDRLWDRIDQNLRRLVERAREEGIEVTEDEDFDSFFRLHRLVVEEKGAPLYLQRERFERYFRELRERDLVRLYHARLPSGQSVSTAMVLASDHPVSHTVSAAADPDHYDTGASPLLRWRSFEELSEAGYAANDLTDASLNTVSRFKRQLGSELELNLVLRATNSSLFRLERTARRHYWSLRDAVSQRVRPWLQRAGGST